MKERLYKFLSKGRLAPYTAYKWPRPGVWVKAKGLLSVCQNGIHLCREQDLVFWLDNEIYEAEYRGNERLDSDTKIVVREARLKRRLKTWTEKTARLFACDCAEHVLPIFERRYPDNKCPRRAIETARRYVYGKATIKELDGAGVAAGAAAAAARAAAGAAGDAAWAAEAAAGAEEHRWQTKRLMKYLYPKGKRRPE